MWTQRIIFRPAKRLDAHPRQTEDEPSMQSLLGCNHRSRFVLELGENQRAHERPSAHWRFFCVLDGLLFA